MKKAFFSYMAANLIGAFISFLTIPLLSRLLGSADFGKLFIFTTLVWVGNTVLGINLQAAVAVRYKKVGASDLARLVSAGLSVSLGLNIFVQLAILFCAQQLSDFIGIGVGHIRIAIFVSFFNALFLTWQSMQMIQKKVSQYCTQQIASALMLGLGTLILVGQFRLGLNGQVWAIGATHIVMGMVALVNMRRCHMLTERFTQADVIDITGYGLRLMPHMLGVFLFSGLDRLMIPKTLGTSQAGIYNGAASLTAALAILTAAANRTAVPLLYDRIKVDVAGARRLLRSMLMAVIGVGILSAAAAWYVLPPVVEFYLGKEYAGAGQLFPVLLLCQFLFLAYTLASNVVMYAERNLRLSIVTILCGAIFFITYISTYRTLGIQAAPLALLLAWALRCALTYSEAFKCLAALAAQPRESIDDQGGATGG